MKCHKLYIIIYITQAANYCLSLRPGWPARLAPRYTSLALSVCWLRPRLLLAPCARCDQRELSSVAVVCVCSATHSLGDCVVRADKGLRTLCCLLSILSPPVARLGGFCVSWEARQCLQTVSGKESCVQTIECNVKEYLYTAPDPKISPKRKIQNQCKQVKNPAHVVNT